MFMFSLRIGQLCLVQKTLCDICKIPSVVLKQRTYFTKCSFVSFLCFQLSLLIFLSTLKFQHAIQSLNILFASCYGTDDKLDILQCCVLHIAYLLLMMITAAFLHTPLVGRVVLIMVVLSNMAAHLVHNSSLDFAGLTALVASVMMSKCISWS